MGVSKKSERSSTPKSVTDIEKTSIDDDAVSKAVTAESASSESGTKSVLPGPPIPPDLQAKVKDTRQRAAEPGRPEKKSSRARSG